MSSVNDEISEFKKVDQATFHIAFYLAKIFERLDVEIYHPSLCSYWMNKITPDRMGMVRRMRERDIVI